MTARSDAAPVLSNADLLEMHRRMLLIRGFEERVAALYRDGLVPGFVHLSIGQEAAAVGACWPLRADDVITSTHRGHGHCLAKGLDPLGDVRRADGPRRRGRTAAAAAPCTSPTRSSGSSAPTASWPPACRSPSGAATAAQLRDDDRVAVAFFGDGAAAQGAFHEALNLAAVWRLPVIFFCENNGYSEFSAASAQHAASLERRAAGYAHRPTEVDGNDVVATASAMRGAVLAARTGERSGRRRGGHLPLARPLRGRPAALSLRGRGAGVAGARPARPATAQRLVECRRRARRTSTRLESAVAVELDQAVEAGARSPAPSAGDPLRLRRAAAGRRRRAAGDAAAPDADATFRTMDAIHDALESELAADERVFLAGVDVGEGGNVFGLTRGLRERFGERVRDTPISETAIVGLGVGAAMAGMRPVVEVMYLDFLGVCFDQLLNQAAKLPFMTGGAAEMALTVRTQFGAGRSSGSQHSQSLEALLAHIPGLTVVMPSTPADTYGLLRAAIQDPNPVVFIENRLLYGMKGPRTAGRPPRPDRALGRRAPGLRRHRRVGVAHGARGARPRPRRWPPRASRSR